jgi:hypothetical protein
LASDTAVAKDNQLSSPPTSVFSVSLPTWQFKSFTCICSMKMYDTEQFVKYHTSVKKDKIKMNI